MPPGFNCGNYVSSISVNLVCAGQRRKRVTGRNSLTRRTICGSLGRSTWRVRPSPAGRSATVEAAGSARPAIPLTTLVQEASLWVSLIVCRMSFANLRILLQVSLPDRGPTRLTSCDTCRSSAWQCMASKYGCPRIPAQRSPAHLYMHGNV